MKYLLILPLLGATAVIPASAQDRTPAQTDSACTTDASGRRECTYRRTLRVGSGADFHLMPSRHDSAMMKRAVLGLELRPTGTRRDTLGVFVAAVTPKGPAEAAGIIEGDRIASINGVDLRTVAADVEDDYTNGLASHRLSREVRKLSPGGRVNLRVYSQGRYRDVSVTAGRASDLMRSTMRIRVPRGGQEFEFHGPGAMQMRESFPRMPMLRRAAPPRVKIIQPGPEPAPERMPQGVTLLDADMIELDELDAPMMLDGEFEEVEIGEEEGPIPEPIRKIAK